MSAISSTARWFPAAARLRENAQRAADRIIARARAAYQLGATADAHRTDALELEHQATRAERLLFGQAIRLLRIAATESRLVADALDTIETGKNI